MSGALQAAKAVIVAAFLGVTVNGCADVPGGESPPDSAPSLPMIAHLEEAADYPLAEVSGTLELRHGCLLLGGDVVFWPYGTQWDATAQAVVVANTPLFEDAPAVAVGEVFRDGGAHYSSDTRPRPWSATELAGPIEACQRATGTKDVVYAYPTMS